MFKKVKFTLIEFIIVIAFFGVLASIVVPNVSYMQERAKTARTADNIKKVQSAVNMYFRDNENYPTSLQPVEGLREVIDYELLDTGYLSKQPFDELTYVVDFKGIVGVLGSTQPNKQMELDQLTYSTASNGFFD